jgi:phenylpyruvate tautomerase
MPLLKIQVNTAVSGEQAEALLSQGTDMVVNEMNKPREYVQVMLEPDTAIAFAGTRGPSAFVELRSLGLREDLAKLLSGKICALLEAELGIPPARVFINFFDFPRPMWGWDGETFG